MECTIHEPWLEQSQLKEAHYFHVQDPIPAHHDQQWCITKNGMGNSLKITPIIKCYLLFLLLHRTVDYLHRLYGVYARKRFHYHLDTAYQITKLNLEKWKIYNPPKKLCRKSGTNIAKEKKEVMTPQTSVHVIQGYKRHTRENHHSSKPHAQMLRRDNMTFFSVTMPFTHHHFTDGYKMLSIITNQIQLISY